jgi:hypothetical protein
MVSLEDVLTRIHPEGGTHGAATAVVAWVVVVGDGEAVSVVVAVRTREVTVAVGVGKLNGRVGGIWVGVASAGRLSARERKIPPSTRITEAIAIKTPTPSCRKACIC